MKYDSKSDFVYVFVTFIWVFLAFYFILEYNWLGVLWWFWGRSRATQPYTHLYPFCKSDYYED